MRLNEEVESRLPRKCPDGSRGSQPCQRRKRSLGDTLLYAVGRQGSVDDLNLAGACIEADSRGRIMVDSRNSSTKTAPHFYAVGDVIGFPSASLRFPWSRGASLRRPCVRRRDREFGPGQLSVRHLHHSRKSRFLGKTEEQLTDEDVPYEVGVAYYREIARGQIRGDTTGRLKLIFHRESHAILGVHIIGEGASELVHIGQAVMALGGKLDYFVETVFNYPTLAECYKVAAFNGLNRVSKFE